MAKFRVILTQIFEVDTTDQRTADYIIDRDICEYGPIGHIQETLRERSSYSTIPLEPIRLLQEGQDFKNIEVKIVELD